MNLASYQRAVRDKLKARPPSDESGGTGLPDDSPRLRLLQEIVLWWRLYAIEEFCVLTSRLLKRRGEFEPMVMRHIAEHHISPYIEEMSLLFLDTISRESDPLLAAVARFETAMIRTKKGDQGTYSIQWPQEPYGIIADLLGLGSTTPELSSKEYRAIVCHNLPHGFVVEEVFCQPKRICPEGGFVEEEVSNLSASFAAETPLQLRFTGVVDSAARTSRTCWRREFK